MLVTFLLGVVRSYRGSGPILFGCMFSDPFILRSIFPCSFVRHRVSTALNLTQPREMRTGTRVLELRTTSSRCTILISMLGKFFCLFLGVFGWGPIVGQMFLQVANETNKIVLDGWTSSAERSLAIGRQEISRVHAWEGNADLVRCAELSDEVVKNHWRRSGGKSDMNAHDDNRLGTHAKQVCVCLSFSS